ncbi:MAG: LexA family protein [Candidatus Muiribacteriaceae bacterium]
MRLTKKQEAFLNELVTYTEENGFPPTITELCKVFGVSIGTVQQYFFALERKGVIKRDNNKGRGIRILIDLPHSDGRKNIIIPLISSPLKDRKNVFSKENVIGKISIPQGLFEKERLAAAKLDDNLLFFATDDKEKGISIYESDGNLTLSANKSANSLGKVVYTLRHHD